MQDTSNRFLLQIEPSQDKESLPVEDALTWKMERLLAAAEKGAQWRGSHACVCGERSGSCDLIVKGGYTTNSLAAHYLRWHRSEVPECEIEKLRGV